MFTTINNVLFSFNLDYFLVGAIARDIQLSSQPGFAAKRKTNDIDIAVLIDTEDQFYQIKEALIATGQFEQASNNPIKLIYRHSIELDLLPFGEIENEERILTLNKDVLFSMDMSGFKEVYPFVKIHSVANDIKLKVCSLEGIVLLKLISNDNNPNRTKDITDIEHLITVYFELYDSVIYNDYFDVMDLYSTQSLNYLHLVSARVIGRKINTLLTKNEGKKNVTRILTRRPTETWQAMLDGLND